MKKTKNSKSGFSLIELIFVISVLGIIATFAVPKLMGTRSGAVVTTIKQDISTITTAIQAQYMLNGKINNIKDSVNINEKNWRVEDKQVVYEVDDSVCVTISVESSSLIVEINETSSDICKKLSETGVVDITYEMI